MDAKEVNLVKFISEKAKFIIPVYQRNYDWKKSNCDRLFSDIENIIATNKSHFLGTIVCQSFERGYFSDYIIIDGQQRIASVILLGKALCEVIGDSKIKKIISSTFIKHSDGELENQLRLKPSEYDSAVFQKLMTCEKFNDADFNDTEKLSALYFNYKFFLQRISESKFLPEQIYNALSRLKIVLITLKDENPQEIFESLNSTGLDLSNADLIRNYLIMELDYDAQEILYKEYWLRIELLLKSSDAVENFIVQYLITKRRSDSISDEKKSRLSKNNLYYSFKQYFEDNYTGGEKVSNVENFLKDMYYYAQIYRRVTFNENTKFSELSELAKKFYELTYLLDVNNASIILMYLYDRYERKNFDTATFIKFVDALISLAFRSKVCKFNVISSQFAGNVIARLDKNEILDEEIFWQVLTFGKGKYSFPRDEEFKAALTTEKLYVNLKSDGCKYFLYALEKFTSGGTLPSYSSAVVEHIIPQRLNSNWRSYLKEQNDLQAHEYFAHTLGNLVLTVDADKSESDEFDDKKQRFVKSKFVHTKEVASFSKMNSKQIQVRAKKLANIAVNVWALPEKYNDKIKKLENVYNLDNDFKEFTNTKPATVSILNVERNVKTWKAFVIEVLKQLYALDADNFILATRSDNVARYFSATTSNLRQAAEFENNFYVETNQSSANFLQMINRVVENFDEMAGTNIKNEIWFTLNTKNKF